MTDEPAVYNALDRSCTAPVGVRPQSWTVIRLVLVALLIATGVLKVMNSASLLAAGGLLGSTSAITFVVGFEFFAAGFIAFSPAAIARRFALVLFTVFALVSGWAMWSDRDCGCFGGQSPRGLPLMIDVAA